MPVITEAERKGNPARKATDKAKDVAAATPKETTTVVKTIREDSISGHDARELGPSAVTRGALERAEQHVAAGHGAYPQGDPDEKPLTRIVVDFSGKVIPESQATNGGTVLTGAEADAYLAKHGGPKAESISPAANAKRAKKAPNKARKGSANKARRR
jgi:hypothetical protein